MKVMAEITFIVPAPKGHTWMGSQSFDIRFCFHPNGIHERIMSWIYTTRELEVLPNK
jgi:hypothetical protein